MIYLSIIRPTNTTLTYKLYIRHFHFSKFSVGYAVPLRRPYRHKNPVCVQCTACYCAYIET